MRRWYEGNTKKMQRKPVALKKIGVNNASFARGALQCKPFIKSRVTLSGMAFHN
jgi:hypothetical protein